MTKTIKMLETIGAWKSYNLKEGDIVELPDLDAYKLLGSGVATEVYQSTKTGGEGSGYPRVSPTARSTVASPPLPNQVKPPSPNEQKTAYDKLIELVGNDLVEVFGDYGSGKSRLLGHIALESQNAGKKVLYLDNENSLPNKVRGKLENYLYTGINLDQILEGIAGLEKGLDLICLDSIGYPVLVNYVELSLREQLRSIQKMILLRARLKDYAIENRALAIATNQPVSEYSIAELPRNEKEHAVLEPFGGKGAFISKLLLRTEPIQKGEITKIAIKTYKARDFPFDKKIAEFVITSERTELRWL